MALSSHTNCKYREMHSEYEEVLRGSENSNTKSLKRGEMDAHLILYLLQHYISIIQICFLQIPPHFPL